MAVTEPLTTQDKIIGLALLVVVIVGTYTWLTDEPEEQPTPSTYNTNATERSNDSGLYISDEELDAEYQQQLEEEYIQSQIDEALEDDYYNSFRGY